jgi:hypothetical protein
MDLLPLSKIISVFNPLHFLMDDKYITAAVRDPENTALLAPASKLLCNI